MGGTRELGSKVASLRGSLTSALIVCFSNASCFSSTYCLKERMCLPSISSGFLMSFAVLKTNAFVLARSTKVVLRLRIFRSPFSWKVVSLLSWAVVSAIVSRP